MPYGASGLEGRAEVRIADFALGLAREYHPDEQAVEVLVETGCFTVSSIVSGGKGTVCEILMLRDFCDVATSDTTRAVEPRDVIDPKDAKSLPRPNSYNFVDLANIAGKMLAREMLEVEIIHDNIYGTSLNALKHVERSGKRPLLEIDIKGVKNLKAVYQELPSFFIVPPSFHVWMNRWAERDGVFLRLDNFGARVETARSETGAALEMFNNGQMHLIMNENAEAAADDITRGVESGILVNGEQGAIVLSEIIDSLRQPTEEVWKIFQQSRSR